jgi:aspartate kinase
MRSASHSSANSHLERPWLVQKFGGTSIGKFIETITDTIVP